MSDALLQFAFPITTESSSVSANTAYLHQVLAVCKPKGATPAGITLCTSSAAAAVLTDNVDVLELFSAGLTQVYVCVNADLNIDALVNPVLSNFYTVLISSDFTTGDLSTMDLGDFEGVVGYAFTGQSDAKAFALVENQVGFYTIAANKSKNMFYAFGKLLAAQTWGSKQYKQMPYNDLVILVGTMLSMYNDKVSFVLTSPEGGNRLGFFSAGGKAITAPYILKEINIALQAAAVAYIEVNEPDYTAKEAALLENDLNNVILSFIDSDTISGGSISITITDGSNFNAVGTATIPEPKALWRVPTTLRVTQ